jgi:hypothetical protein
MAVTRKVATSMGGTNLADLLERILDKGIVIVGDIKVKLVDIELLTIQIRLMVASVDKAREMGMDWWIKNPEYCSSAAPVSELGMDDVTRRLDMLERRLAPQPVPAVP